MPETADQLAEMLKGLMESFEMNSVTARKELKAFYLDEDTLKWWSVMLKWVMRWFNYILAGSMTKDLEHAKTMTKPSNSIEKLQRRTLKMPKLLSSVECGRIGDDASPVWTGWRGIVPGEQAETLQGCESRKQEQKLGGTPVGAGRAV